MDDCERYLKVIEDRNAEIAELKRERTKVIRERDQLRGKGSGSEDPGSIVVTPEITANLIQNLQTDLQRRNLAWYTVVLIIERIKSLVTFTAKLLLNNFNECSDILLALSANLSGAARYYQLVLLEQRWQSIEFKVDPAHIDTFIGEISAIQDAITLAVESPDAWPALAAQLMNTAIDKDFSNLVKNARQRKHARQEGTLDRKQRIEALAQTGLSIPRAAAQIANEDGLEASSVENAYRRIKKKKRG